MADQITDQTTPDPASAIAGTSQHHGFHRLPVARVVDETADTRSIVLAIPEDLRPAFVYEAGQFCTFRVEVDGGPEMRCYSMSSAPAVDAELAVTVKRVPDGKVSNWLNDNVAAGTEVDVTRPAGVFCLTEQTGDIVAFAAGSGITPVISIIKEALATTSRRVWLLYANRDEGATIFRTEIGDLAAAHPDRLRVVHHLDADRGFLDEAAIVDFLGQSFGDGPAAIADAYVCGPTVFMDIAEAGLESFGLDASRLHIERFGTPPPIEPLPEDATDDGDVAMTITMTVEGRTETADYQPGTTVLQTAKAANLRPPSSCEAGSCATCMARVVEGTVTMRVNDALDDDEVEEGWILTCQAVPTSEKLEVVFGYD